MSGTVILVIIIAITILLGRYAIAEGQRVERQKKMLKNMENFNKKGYVESSKRNKQTNR